VNLPVNISDSSKSEFIDEYFRLQAKVNLPVNISDSSKSEFIDEYFKLQAFV
jgi:hypothetical protein